MVAVEMIVVVSERFLTTYQQLRKHLTPVLLQSRGDHRSEQRHRLRYRHGLVASKSHLQIEHQIIDSPEHHLHMKARRK